MFSFFGNRHREAAQRAADEQLEAQRQARRELADLALAQNFTGDEIKLIREYESAKLRYECIAMTNALGRTAAEAAILSAQYIEASRAFSDACANYYAMLANKRIVRPALN